MPITGINWKYTVIQIYTVCYEKVFIKLFFTLHSGFDVFFNI